MLRGVLAVLAAAMVLAALVFARPHATPGPPMRDFEAYYAAGNAWRIGTDPYSAQLWNYERDLAGVQKARLELLPFVGPPPLLPVFSVLARLSFASANVLWRVILGLSIGALILSALHLCGLRATPFTVATAAIFALGFGPLTSAFALGQIVLPAFACTVAALFRPAAGLLAWFQPNVALALVAQLRRRAGVVAFVSCAAAFAVLCMAVSGIAGSLHYLEIVRAHAQAERFALIQITPAAIAYGLGASPALAIRIGYAVIACAIVAWLFMMRRITDDAARFSGTCALLPFAMPFFHEHDLIVLFVPALYFSVRCSARAWPLVASGALLCATDWLGLAQRPDGLVQTLLLVGAAGIALCVLRDDLPARALAVPAGVLAVIAIAGMLVYAHPAPVWPDAMRALPAMVLQGNGAQIWSAEQIASGLLARNVLWALLRCGSLAGCIALAYAACLPRRDPLSQMSTFIISSNSVTAPG